MRKKSYAYINNNLLIWARSMTPFKTTEMVELACPKISAKNLHSWEKGDSFPSVSEAKKLASLYKLPFAAFYLSEKPAKTIKRYTDRRTLKGCYTKDISYTLWSEIRRIESNRDSILEYASDDTSTMPIPSIKNDNSTEIASSIREYLGLNTPLPTRSSFGNNPFNYFRNIIEHKGIIVAQVSGVEIEEMKGLSIYFDSYPIIAINNKDYDRSKVFSLFHELAHIFRRSSSLCTIDIEEHSDQEELICDRIAAETLMPETPFRQMANNYISTSPFVNPNSVERIAGHFGVSSLSALRRMYETKIITKKAFFDLWQVITESYNANMKKIEANRKGKNIPVHFYIKYLNQNGYLLPRTILLAFAAGKITHGEMCKVFNINSRHISNIEQAVMFK